MTRSEITDARSRYLHRSFVRKDGSDDDAGSNTTGSLTFKGQTRSNDTHVSRTDGDARLYRKGKTASQLSYMGHTPRTTAMA